MPLPPALLVDIALSVTAIEIAVVAALYVRSRRAWTKIALGFLCSGGVLMLAVRIVLLDGSGLALAGLLALSGAVHVGAMVLLVRGFNRDP